MKNFFKLLIGEDITIADIIPALIQFGQLLLLLSAVSIIENL